MYERHAMITNYDILEIMLIGQGIELDFIVVGFLLIVLAKTSRFLQKQ